MPVPRRRAVVEELLDAADGGRRHVDQAGGPEAVVDVDVPLVAERPGARTEVSVWVPVSAAAGVSRQKRSLAYVGRHLDVGGARVDQEVLPGQCVRRTAAVRRRAEARIDPRARPRGRVQRVDRRVEVRLLVGDERPVRRVRAVDRVRPARLPEDLVAAEEGEVHARVARGLDVRCARRPTSTRRGRWRRTSCGSAAAPGSCRGRLRDVADVVAVLLEEADHLVLGVPEVRACRRPSANEPSNGRL